MPHHSRNPDTRSCALLRVTRSILGLPLTVVGEAVGRRWSTISNAEEARFRLGEETERKLLLFYLAKFVALNVDIDLPPEDTDLPELRVAVAKAVVLTQTRNLLDSSSGLDMGEEDFVDSAVEAGLRRSDISNRFANRLRERIRAEKMAVME